MKSGDFCVGMDCDCDRCAAIDWSQWDTTGIDTEGCDCGHEGMGQQWHLRGCKWRNS